VAAGIGGALALIFGGLALAASRNGFATDALDRRRPGGDPLRLTAAVVGLAAAAFFCGYQLNLLYETCRRDLLVPSRGGLALEGRRFDQLLTLHAVLIFAVLLAGVGLAGRSTARHRPGDRLGGLAGLLCAVASAVAVQATFPASVYDRSILPYAFLSLLIGVPAALVLLIASLMLILRRSCREDADLPDFPLCAVCGYNLTGNMSGRCPECGHPLAESLKVRLRSTSMDPSKTAAAARPKAMIWACHGFACFWLMVTLWRHFGVGASALRQLLPQLEFWVLASGPRYAYGLPRAVAILVDVSTAVVLIVAAWGLRRQRGWATGLCFGWLAVVIPLAVWDGALTGCGLVYGVSPGHHWDPLVLRVALTRTAIGAAFPIGLMLWLLRRRPGGGIRFRSSQR